MDDEFIDNKKNQSHVSAYERERKLAEEDYQRRAAEYNDRIAVEREAAIKRREEYETEM